MRFERMIAIRLVSQQADTLAKFFECAFGCLRRPSARIADWEMSALGVAGEGHRTCLTLDGMRIEIDEFEVRGRSALGAIPSNDPHFQHFAITTDDIAHAWERVLSCGGRPISSGGPVLLPPSDGSVIAVKFHDPEGHPLELLQFTGTQLGSEGGGGATSKVPSAVAHSAIVVTDVATSIGFYHERGLRIGQRTLNWGTAQGALDGLRHPIVDVVPMIPCGAGPNLELLYYRGQAAALPLTLLQSNDVAATRLVWEAVDHALIRDPDGHLHQCQPRGMHGA
jgi:catechol 2,3-dioxygenase-like lactoylglutathione lyase family enzyme